MAITALRCPRQTLAPLVAPSAATAAHGRSRSVPRGQRRRSATVQFRRARYAPPVPSAPAPATGSPPRTSLATRRPADEPQRRAPGRWPTTSTPSRSRRGCSAGEARPRVARPLESHRSSRSNSAGMRSRSTSAAPTPRLDHGAGDREPRDRVARACRPWAGSGHRSRGMLPASRSRVMAEMRATP